MSKLHNDAIFFRLPEELGEAARRKARADGVELSVAIRALLSKWIRGEILRGNGQRLDVTRLCPECHWPLTASDEAAGNCPGCGAALLSLTH